MAGIIAASGGNDTKAKGVAPRSEIYAVKVFDKRGLATTASIMAGIIWSIENNMQIINMSFGTYCSSYILEKLINKAVESGLILVAAAGNEGTFNENRLRYPAEYKNVIAVGSGTAEKISSFSNVSNALDFVAPGKLTSTDLNRTYTHVIGTSVSAAYITGTLAILWSAKPQMNAEHIRNVAKSAALVDKNVTGWVGYGEIDIDDALTNCEKYSNIKKNIIDNYTVSSLNATSFTDESPTFSNFSLSSSVDCWCKENSNDKETAYPVSHASSSTGVITSPDDELWFVFRAIDPDAHPNNSPGWYTIMTQGHLDTIGYLYDSDDNLIGFNDDYTDFNFVITALLEYGKTYYVKVKSFDTFTGEFDLVVNPIHDDVGSTIQSALDLHYVDTRDIYLPNSYLHVLDEDYYSFEVKHDCIMEIYTEYPLGTNTRGIMFDSRGIKIAENSNGNGNGGFKIRYYFKANEKYYICVKPDIFSGSRYYNLYFKFIQNYYYPTLDGNNQYRIIYWISKISDNIGVQEWDTIKKTIICNRAKYEYYHRVLMDVNGLKNELGIQLSNPQSEDAAMDIIDFLFGKLIGAINPKMELVYDISTLLFDQMSIDEESQELIDYENCCKAYDDESHNIIMLNLSHTTDDGTKLIGNAVYSEECQHKDGQLIYLGDEFLRGDFTEIMLKSN